MDFVQFSLWRLVGTLALVAACVPLTFLWLRRQMPRVSASDPSHLQLTGRLPVSSTVSLVTVQVQGREYLLSIGPDRAELLDQLQSDSPAAAPRPIRLKGAARA